MGAAAVEDTAADWTQRQRRCRALGHGRRALNRRRRLGAFRPGRYQVDLFQVMKMATMDTIGLSGFGYDFGCCDELKYSEVAQAFEYLLDE